MKIVVEKDVVPGKRDKEKVCRIVLTTAEQKEHNFRVHTLVRKIAKRELQAKRLESMGIVCSPTSSTFSFCEKDIMGIHPRINAINNPLIKFFLNLVIIFLLTN